MRDNERVQDIDLAQLQLARKARIMQYEINAAEWEQKYRRADRLMYALIVLAVLAVVVLFAGIEWQWW